MIVSAQHMTGFYQPWFQIKEEFRRITAVHLEQTFLTKLDFYTPKLWKILETTGGVACRNKNKTHAEITQSGKV